MDRISKLPLGVSETILCLLPIQEAARTSILSKEWRYHWTKIPKLVFDEDTFEVSAYGAEPSVLEQTFDEPSERKEMTTRCKLFYAIYQVLLMHQGPIHEFTLSMSANGSCVEIDHILLNLARRNNVKILKLDLNGVYKLPVTLFSLHQLTDLHLKDCYLDRAPSFNGFGSLTTLYLEGLIIDENMLLRLLSGCPLLKRLTLNYDGNFNSSVTNLFKCLPILEYLSVWSFIASYYFPLPNEIPTMLVHLKCLRMEYACIGHDEWLDFFVFLIRSFPHLEKLTLMLNTRVCSDHATCTSTLKDYPDIKLDHLNELEIHDLRNTKDELDFAKLILAKSSALKKVTIFLYEEFVKDEELDISKVLLRSPCASPVVKVIVRYLDG